MHCLNKANKGSRAKPALYNSIRKHGADKFEIKPLVIVGTKQEMDYYETSLIKAWDLRDAKKGYNLTDGGEGTPGRKMSEENRLAISLRMRGNKQSVGRKHSDETKLKMSLAAKGNNNGLGHTMPEEVKQRLRGNKHALGHKQSEESNERKRAALLGNKYALGYKHTEDAKERIRLSLLRNSRGSK
jgi:group I intron endonuclease